MFESSTLVAVVFLLAFAFALVSVARMVSDGVTRRRLIRAGSAPELASAIAAAREDPGLYRALRWGIVAGTAGLALMVVQFLPYRSSDPIVLGVMLLFVGAGLLAYYLTAWRLVHRERTGAA